MQSFDTFAYQQALFQILEDAFLLWETIDDMTAEQACDRLRFISDTAFLDESSDFLKSIIGDSGSHGS